MLLRQGGLDIFYVDESHDGNHYVVTAVRVPFLRNLEGNWQITWPDFLAGAKAWRRAIREQLHIPRTKELHGVKLASGRGKYLDGRHNLKPKQAAHAMRQFCGWCPLCRLQVFSLPPQAAAHTCTGTNA